MFVIFEIFVGYICYLEVKGGRRRRGGGNLLTVGVEDIFCECISLNY